MPPSAAAARTSDFQSHAKRCGSFLVPAIPLCRALWENELFVTSESFGNGFFSPFFARKTQHTSPEHARTRIFMHVCHMCKQPVLCKDACPQYYPHILSLGIMVVENLWIMWISAVETAIFRHFPPAFLWITLWILWMNTFFGCA